MYGALRLKISGTVLPAASGVTRVGACTPASSATSVSSLNLGLPAAAVAGDVVLASIISNADQYVGAYSNSGPVGSTKFVADTSFQHPAPRPGVGSAYAVRLSATDITNGYVTFNFTNLPSGSIRGVVWRGVSQTMFDVAAGVAASTATVANPFTFAAPGITTDTDGCTLVAMGAVDATVTTALTDPTGYTVGDVGNDINILQQFAYQQQASAGATGDVSMTFGPDSSISPQGWFAWLVALRPIAPAITLSANFPTNLHVGDTGSFNITATRIDGATGSLTITGSSLPDGMTVGTTTDNGDDTFTATATYDLTTVQDITASFGTTGGSVAATALTHEFVVTNQTVDDFSVAGTISNYTITKQGTPTGTGAVSGGKLVLTPAANAVDSVAARRAGPWKGVKVHASLAKLTTGGTPRYFDITIGSGAVVATNGTTGWNHTTLANGYSLQWNNATQCFILQKMVSGANTNVGNYAANFSDSGTGLHDYELRYNSVTEDVELVLDGVVAVSYSDPAFAAGDVLIAQGAFTDGSGCVASIATVTLTP